MNIKKLGLIFFIVGTTLHSTNAMNNFGIDRLPEFFEYQCWLLKAGVGFLAEVEVKQAMEQGDTLARVWALDLCRRAVEHKKELMIPEQMAELGIQDDDPHVRTAALLVFRALVKQGEAITSAKKAMWKGLKDDALGVQIAALGLYEKLGKRVDAISNILQAQERLIETERYQEIKRRHQELVQKNEQEYLRRQEALKRIKEEYPIKKEYPDDNDRCKQQ